MHRWKLGKDLPEAFEEIYPHAKVIFEVINARVEREACTRIGLDIDTYAMFWKKVLNGFFVDYSERVWFIRQLVYSKYGPFFGTLDVEDF